MIALSNKMNLTFKTNHLNILMVQIISEEVLLLPNSEAECYAEENFSTQLLCRERNIIWTDLLNLGHTGQIRGYNFT
jgi:hypothetical protein